MSDTDFIDYRFAVGWVLGMCVVWATTEIRGRRAVRKAKERRNR